MLSGELPDGDGPPLGPPIPPEALGPEGELLSPEDTGGVPPLPEGVEEGELLSPEDTGGVLLSPEETGGIPPPLPPEPSEGALDE